MTDEKNVVLKVRGLKKSFGSLEVLKGVDVDIHKGEVVVVIGPSGSGKSTFLRCLNLLEKPSGGVRVPGRISLPGRRLPWLRR